jgi:hypothetical protein
VEEEEIMTILCPKCGSDNWKAIEQFTAFTPCQLVRETTGEVQIEFDMRAELARNAATSIILSYACDQAGCGYTISATDLQAGSQ